MHNAIFFQHALCIVLAVQIDFLLSFVKQNLFLKEKKEREKITREIFLQFEVVSIIFDDLEPFIGHLLSDDEMVDASNRKQEIN